jgi:hypothetical protein
LLEESRSLAEKSGEADHLHDVYARLSEYYRQQGMIDSALVVLQWLEELGKRKGVLKWVQESYARRIRTALE